MRRWLTVIVFVVGCKGKEAEPKPSPNSTSPKPTTQEPVASACAKATEKSGSIAWIPDDYNAALACAKERKVPIVLDMWAPWCHTCVAIRTTMFTDPSFGADASKFVFAALDTDRDANAAAVTKFQVWTWPTFYIVSPDEQVLARFEGPVSLAQFHEFMDTGRRVMAGGVDGANARLLAAERLLAQKKLADAEKELAAAVAAAPADWKRRPEALTSLITTRGNLNDWAGCLALAESISTKDPKDNELGNAASANDFWDVANTCASERAKDEPARVKKVREASVAYRQKLLDDPGAPLSIDDHVGPFVGLRQALVDLGNNDRAKAVAEKERVMMDEAAAKAPSPLAAMAFNMPRAEVYTFLGKPLDLVPALEKSVKDLPDQYDPPARLGFVYMQGNKLDEAAKWTDKALAMAYGARKVKVLNQRATIASKQGNKADERKFREEMVKALEALPPSQTSPEAIKGAKQVLADLDKPAKP